MSAQLQQWPSPQFLELDKHVQESFYKEALSLNKGGDVVKLVEHKLEKYKIEEFEWAFGGEFLPLDVLAVRGFDRERIARTTPAEDIVETEQCGKCYRVKILSSRERGVQGAKRSMTLGVEPASKRARLDDGFAGSSNSRGTLPLPAPEAPAVESRADFLARQKNEKDERRQLDKAAWQKRAQAAQIVKKMAGPMKGLSDALKHERTPELGSGIVKQAREALAAAKLMHAAINKPIDGNSAVDASKQAAN
jgi:hypothetical protein